MVTPAHEVGPLRRAIRFRLERWIQGGALNQILFAATLIAGVAITGGLFAWLLSDEFAGPFDAIWWSFLRLTDPGYLGDDEGAVLRTISTAITLCGYVLFMGSLVAIMTSWLTQTLRRLESGLTPISMKGHVVVLGWTNRTPETIAKLLGAQGRLRRFLDERGLRKLQVVVLAEPVDAARRLELAEAVGPLWNDSQVHLRSGSSLEEEDLERLDVRRASAIVVPASDFELGGAELTDTRVVKTLLTLRRLLETVPEGDRPLVVAEVLEPNNANIAETAFGPGLEVVASEVVISRIIAQSVRHHRLSRVIFELLSHRQGHSLYVRRFTDLAGANPLALLSRFPRAIVLGAVRREGARNRTYLCPPRDFALREDDLLVFLAREYKDCEPLEACTLELPKQVESAAGTSAEGSLHRVLILGWSYKVDSILAELGCSGAGPFDVTIVSRTEVGERQIQLTGTVIDERRVTVRHVVADYSNLAVLESLEPARFDSIAFLASASMATSEQSDARTILGYALVRSMLAELEDPPEVIVELLDPTNSKLFTGTRDVMLVSPRVLSHMLAHVCLRPELNGVYSELFVAGGVELVLRRAAAFGVAGRPVVFDEVQREAVRRGEIALGFVRAPGTSRQSFELDPDRATSFQLDAEDELIVLASDREE
ncbi:MAG: hypothetical protein R3F34_13870 [Planctomycetota bacterium]